METAEILARFESLGGYRHGCEFGLVQRGAGIEPLGLLRWANMPYENLIPALDAAFAGVGEPDRTSIFVPPWNLQTYISRDSRYWMQCHTPIQATIPHDEALRMVCRTQKFLVRKLLDDLRSGEKIFVYKRSIRRLSDDEILRLHRAIRRHGPGALLVLNQARPANPHGTVQVMAEGLYVGYLGSFDRDLPAEVRHNLKQAWTPICVEVSRLHDGHPPLDISRADRFAQSAVDTR